MLREEESRHIYEKKMDKIEEEKSELQQKAIFVAKAAKHLEDYNKLLEMIGYLCSCPICFEIRTLQSLPECGHLLCTSCLNRLQSPFCPSCRAYIERKPEGVIHELKPVQRWLCTISHRFFLENTQEDVTSRQSYPEFTNPPSAHFPEHFQGRDSDGNLFGFRIG